MIPRKTRASIVGVGSALPERVVTNFDLEKLMDTSDEWIFQRSGIRQRRHIDEGMQGTDLALAACQTAMKQANWKQTDIDLIIFATCSPEVYMPGPCVILQKKLGCDTTPSMDVRCQCSGFIYSITTARAFIESGIYKRVLVVGAETQSRALRMNTEGRDIAVLFGDGAGVVCLEALDCDVARLEGPSERTSDQRSYGVILDSALYSQGEYFDKLGIQEPGMNTFPFLSEEKLKRGLHFPRMEGKLVFKHAVQRLLETTRDLLVKNQLTPQDIQHFVFHQANVRINEMVMRELGVSTEKAPTNIAEYGNTSAASIPILLSELKEGKLPQKIESNDLMLLGAFGAGFTWGGVLVKWH